MRSFQLSLRLLATLLLGSVLAATGCTGSDPLQPNSNNFALTVIVDNPSSRFDIASFRILQFDVRTVDPNAAGATQTPIGLIGPVSEQMLIDLNNAPQATLTKALANGTYRLEQIQLASLLFRDNDPPASSATCEEFITFYPTQPPGGTRAELFDLGQDVTFTVDNSGTNTLTIRIDGQAFLDAYQSGWFCNPQGFAGCTRAWCLDTINGWQEFTFTLSAGTFLSFQ